MKKLKSYTNVYGQTFDLFVQKSDISDLDKECWGYKFVVKHAEWGKITMRAGIRKTFINDEASADIFIEEEPLKKMMNHLDAVNKIDKYPLFSDDLEKGWFVV